MLARDGAFANSCLIATLGVEEFGTVAAARSMAKKINTELYEMGGSDYTLPAQRASDFLKGKVSSGGSLAQSVETGSCPGRIDELLPPVISGALRRALHLFDRRIPGFIDSGCFVGVESIVSSPLRFERDGETLASSLPGLWIAGEGAGAAGGIVSAACDGIRCAEALLRCTK
jgi:uncharacterized FAD-dependent dehydrogenase